MSDLYPVKKRTGSGKIGPDPVKEDPYPVQMYRVWILATFLNVFYREILSQIGTGTYVCKKAKNVAKSHKLFADQISLPCPCFCMTFLIGPAPPPPPTSPPQILYSCTGYRTSHGGGLSCFIARGGGGAGGFCTLTNGEVF